MNTSGRPTAARLSTANEIANRVLTDSRDSWDALQVEGVVFGL